MQRPGVTGYGLPPQSHARKKKSHRLYKLLLGFFSFSGIIARDKRSARDLRGQISGCWQALCFRGGISQ
jgi:hypothetical protein